MLGSRCKIAGGLPFEAVLKDNGQEAIRWMQRDLIPRLLNQAAELFSEGMTVREVAATLRISRSEAGRLRIRASSHGLLVLEEELNRAEMINEDNSNRLIWAKSRRVMQKGITASEQAVENHNSSLMTAQATYMHAAFCECVESL